MKKQFFVLSVFVLVFSFSLLLGNDAFGAMIDFETVPGSSPSDKLAINNQYEALFGVTFSTEGGGTPYLEKVGGNDTNRGFVNDILNLEDTAAKGYESQIGDYFLRLDTNDLMAKPVPDLIISYSTPVSAASGQIWDIDGTSALGFEQWIVNAYDFNGSPIDSVTSPQVIGLDSLDGKPWTWVLRGGTNFDISEVRISFSDASGSKSTKIGFGFDNFSPVPLPSAVWLLGCGLIGLVGLRRKLRR